MISVVSLPGGTSTSPNQSKPQMLEGLLSCALNAGIEAEYFLADAWFATKQVLTLTQDHSLTAIVRTYPAAVAQAKTYHARLYFLDEASFRSDAHRETT